MQTGTISATTPNRSELPAMLATLCSYENWFGPYHPQTLRLMTQVAVACWHEGAPECARAMLEKAIANLGRSLGLNHDLRLSAMVVLRDLFVSQRDYQKAAAVAKELLECQSKRLGDHHPETLAVRANLAQLLLQSIDGHSSRKV
jgi:hypothetical protein